ncbi:MAG: Penicillin-binding protein, 1A family [Candidatus Wolfebacteria bacterium GW2011_GWA2_47_9b]|uniref:Penicillin-binding protein, 1A family n=2 Tax=Parcubacteria group TaxID=1794811 RepID=A0A0G1X3C7_9BACT|nr:MAG: Penicillin-binding protein, 1A family [Candidatus Wolfebacteria bacterium GW2011_GWA2_47_9b]
MCCILMIRTIKKRNKKNKRFPLIVSCVATACVFMALIWAAAILRSLPSPEQFGSRRVNQSTKIYDRAGGVVLYEIHGEEKRTIVPFEEISEFAKKATLAAEDVDFYNQPAFDIKAMIRALIIDLREGRFAQGGSTITQQLAKNALLTPEKTITRKIKEIILAIELESKYTKDQILDLYLNQIPYGGNAYGIEAAGKMYFGKSAADLTLEEAATLAAILKAPSHYSPWGDYKDELLGRKDYVLDRMADAGFISKEEAEAGKIKKLDFLPPSIGSIQAPHFSLMVKEYLIEKYGENMVMGGGLKITTTLDWDIQQAAETSVFDGSENNEKAYGSKNVALVAQDPKTGQILALVGSRYYFDLENEGNFNVALQGLRQPGSALKPFVYMTAFQKGFSPDTVVFDTPTEFDTRGGEDSYKPENFDGTTRGPVVLMNALAQSLNIPAVKVLYLAGVNDSLQNMHNFGITTLKETWRYGLSLVLGGGEVRLIDLVNAYGTLSQDGVRHDQVIILKVEDSSGNILEEYHDKTKRVIEPQFPRLVTQILSSPELRRPIFGSSITHTVFDGYDVALKTGTSEDHKDAWTVGYTPFLVAGVWAGNNDNTAMIRQGSSILAAVPIWSSFMNKIISKYSPERFVSPDAPAYSPKPMLNGEYVWKPEIGGVTYPQIHSILFYVDKRDPLGPFPENPSQDPQFQNWEISVQRWATTYIQGFGFGFNAQIPFSSVFELEKNNKQSGVNDVKISDLKPQNGEFISGPVTVGARVESESGLKKIELLINGSSVNGFELYGKKYDYWFFYSGKLLPQNVVELKVTNAGGFEHAEKSVFYAK